MPIQYGLQPKKFTIPKPTSYGQTARNTTGYRDPFPSLSPSSPGTAAPAPKLQQPAKAAAYGQKPAKPPVQQPNAATALAQSAPAAPQTPVLSGYSYDADPILNQVQALSTQSEENARANAAKLQQQLAIQYGDKELGTLYGGPDTGQAAADNPNSVAAQLAHGYQTSQQSLEDQLNAANLFYSGARIRQLGDLASQYGAQQAGAAGDLRNALAGVDANLSTALSNAAAQRLAAEQAAADRALQAALAAGGAPTTAAPTMPDGLSPEAQQLFNEETGGGAAPGGTPDQIAAAAAAVQDNLGDIAAAQGPLGVPGGDLSLDGGVVSQDEVARALAQLQAEQTGGGGPGGTPAQIAQAANTVQNNLVAGTVQDNLAGMSPITSAGGPLTLGGGASEPTRYYTYRADADHYAHLNGGTVKFRAGRGYYIE